MPMTCLPVLQMAVKMSVADPALHLPITQLLLISNLHANEVCSKLVHKPRQELVLDRQPEHRDEEHDVLASRIA